MRNHKSMHVPAPSVAGHADVVGPEVGQKIGHINAHVRIAGIDGTRANTTRALLQVTHVEQHFFFFPPLLLMLLLFNINVKHNFLISEFEPDREILERATSEW